MPVYSWTFDGNLRKHLVEIEHIPSSGKIRVHLNRQQLLEQENVKEVGWKHYFYIDDELVVAEVVYKDGKYAYDFHEDERQESIRIRRQRRHARSQVLRYAVVATCVILIISAGPYILFNKTDWYRGIRLDRGEGIYVPAMFFWDEVSGPDPRLAYGYEFDGERYYGTLDSARQGSFRTPLGMPVWTGDEFRVRLLGDHPSSHVVDLSRISIRTRERYLERVTATFPTPRLNFVNHDSDEFVHCLLEYVTEVYGIAGWAHIYFHDESGHVADFEEIIQAEGYQRMERECYELSQSDTTLET
jgi:hypothetical protein